MTGDDRPAGGSDRRGGLRIEAAGPADPIAADPGQLSHGDRWIDLAFGLMVVGTFAYGIRVTKGTWFAFDEFLFLDQARSWGGLIDDYNSNLSILMLGLYRVLVEMFGFSYLPFRVAKMLVAVVVPTAFYVSNRRVLTAPLAALMTLPLLWPAGVNVYPGELNHPLAALGGIGCAAALNRGRRADGLLAVSLTFALASTSCGIAVAAACLTHNLIFGAWRRRWVVTALPIATYMLWWTVYWDPPPGDHGRPSVGVALRYAWDLVYAAFDDVALGSGVVAIVLIIGFVIRAASMLRAGRQEAANLLAWTSAAVVWGFGLALTRWFLADASSIAGGVVESSPFRYRLPMLCFLLLAVIPRRPVTWPAGLVQRFDRRWAVAFAAGVLAVGGARAAVVRSDLQDSARDFTLFGQVARGEAFGLGLTPEVIPANQDMGFLYGDMTASEVRDLLEHYGYPFDRDLAHADRAMEELGFVGIVRSGRRDEVQCQPLTEPVEVDQPVVYLWSPDDEWSVEVRRFGREWRKLGAGTSDQVLGVRLGGLSVPDIPFEVRAPGACLVVPPGMARSSPEEAL